jgi:hypothetical protein
MGLMLVEEMRAFANNNRVLEHFCDLGKDTISRGAQEDDLPIEPLQKLRLLSLSIRRYFDLEFQTSVIKNIE